MAENTRVLAAASSADEITEARTTTFSARVYPMLKRLVDVILSATLLLASAPIILFAALCIRLESKGNPFFFQLRLGKGGKPFKICKLRGMYTDSRDRFPHLYDYARNHSLNFYFHNDDDPRITKVGAITRRLSIDELPNFWNVLVGDMSLVGPRPEIPEVLSLYGPYRDKYLSVKPGVTCFSKITGRDHLTKLESVLLDIAYVDQRTMTTDMEVLVKTFSAVVLGRDVRD